MAATPNTHFYEMALIGPDMPNAVPPVYACGYSDQPEALGRRRLRSGAGRAGPGRDYDWDFIENNREEHLVFKAG